MNIHSPYDLAMIFLGMYPREIKLHTYTTIVHERSQQHSFQLLKDWKSQTISQLVKYENN